MEAANVEVGQDWASGERAVRVLETGAAHVVVRDSYGWRRSLTRGDLTNGFNALSDRVERVRGVMARRSLADIDPS